MTIRTSQTLHVTLKTITSGMIQCIVYIILACICCIDSKRLNSQKNMNNSPIKAVLTNTTQFKQYIDYFNEFDDEAYINLVANVDSFEFLESRIPIVDIPDKLIEEIYYFRWWSYRKHIKLVRLQTIQPLYVITEFLPRVSWSGKFNTISCAAGHHFMEGRWLGDTSYLESYAKFWFNSSFELSGNPRQYSFWGSHAIWSFFRISGNKYLLSTIFDGLVSNYRAIERTNYDPTIGLFYNTDNRDGMEMSIGGFRGRRCYRPTLNSYMASDAKVIAKIAKHLSFSSIEIEFLDLYKTLVKNINKYLWDGKDSFYKVLHFEQIPIELKANQTLDSLNLKLSRVRELHGYTPWYFNIPSNENDNLDAWKNLFEDSGFHAEYGLTTAEQRDPEFALEYSKQHECQWNGPVWPYATSVTLTALQNILQNPYLKLNVNQSVYLTKSNFYNQLLIYSKSQHRNITVISTHGNYSLTIPWIDENIHPYTGDFISRTLLSTWENKTWSEKKGGKERGRNYNHSTFVDLILSGLLGFFPRSSHSFEIRPLIPPNMWDYFCLDQLKYRNNYIAIVWDKFGDHYNINKGFTFYVNGIIVKTVPNWVDRIVITF